MRVPLGARLRQEAEQFELRSSCQHCAYFLPATGACVNGWPNGDQRQWPVPDGATEWPFCKEFELA